MSDEWPAGPPAERPGKPERPDRTNLLMSGTIEAEDIAAPVRIRNLSENGALIEGAVLPKVGARLILRRLHLEIGGLVIWTDHSRCGVLFDGTISVAGWRSGNWIAPVVNSDQARVDSIQAAVRGGATFAPTGMSPPARSPEQTDAEIDARVSEELVMLRRMIETMGNQLSDEPAIVRDYPAMLQNFDLACQILGHLADVLAAEKHGAAIDAIGMEELRQRLRRKPGW